MKVILWAPQTDTKGILKHSPATVDLAAIHVTVTRDYFWSCVH